MIQLVLWCRHKDLAWVCSEWRNLELGPAALSEVAFQSQIMKLEL